MESEVVEGCNRFLETARVWLDSLVTSFEDIESLITSSKLLRGKCNGRSEIVDMYIQTGTVKAVVDIFQSITSRQSLKDQNVGIGWSADLLKARKTLVVVLCQLLANFSASGEKSRNYLFSIELNGEKATVAAFSHIVSAAVMSGSRGAVAAFMAMLYNCLQSNGSENAATLDAINQRCLAFSKCRSILCQILLAALDNSKTDLCGGSRKESPVGGGEAADPVLEWFHMTAFVWVRRNLVHSIYTLVGPTKMPEERRGDILPLTHEQLILLQLVSDVVEDPYFIEILNGSRASTSTGEVVSAISSSNVFDSTKDVLGAGGMLDFLLTLSRSLCELDMTVILGPTVLGTAVATTTTSASAAVTGGAGSVEGAAIDVPGSHASDSTLEGENGDIADRIELQMRRDLTADYLPLALQLLASTLACAEKECGKYLREALVTQSALLDATVRILSGKDPGSRARHANQQKATSGASSAVSAGSVTKSGPAVVVSEAQQERGKVCVRACLQLLGNLVYGCDLAKDALRESGALAAVLSHCATDFDNPVSREWALLCVRNACEAHIGNQTFIQELRPQEVVIQDEKLKEQGLRVEMNTETGQFKFINTNDSTKGSTTSSSNSVNASATEGMSK